MIRKLFLSYIFLVSVAFAEYTGMHYLNSFPQTDKLMAVSTKFSRVAIDKGENDLTSDQNIFSVIHHFAWRIDKTCYAGLALPFLITKRDEFIQGGIEGSDYVSKGFTEPEIFYLTRIGEINSEDVVIQDFRISFVPSLFKRKLGTEKANEWRGGHELRFTHSIGARYSTWEARIYNQFEYYFYKEEENLESDTKYKITPYYDYITRLEVQLNLAEILYLAVGSGFSLNSDFDVSSSRSESSALIQRGTGSSSFMRATVYYHNNLYRLTFERLRNDYFITTREQNFKGNYKDDIIQLDYIRTF